MCRHCDDILEDAKLKFKTGDWRQKYTILTALSIKHPKAKVQKTLECGKYIVQRAARLRDAEGTFTYPQSSQKATIKINGELKDKIDKFYKHPDYSRTISGDRNTIRLKFVDKTDDRVQKQQLLFTLDEFYKEFIKENFAESGAPLSLYIGWILANIPCVA